MSPISSKSREKADGSPKEITVGKHGRIVIPADYRQKLGIQEGSELLILFRDGKLELHPAGYRLEQARAIYRKRVSMDRDPVQELIDERREEACDEDS